METWRESEVWSTGRLLTSSNGTRRLVGQIPGFVSAIGIVLASVPFGQLQEIAMGGLTIAKLVLPALFLILVAIRFWDVRAHPHLGVVVAFVVATTPSFVTSDLYPDIVMHFVGYVILFILMHNALRRVRDLRVIFFGYVVGLTIVSIFSLLAFAFGVDLGVAMGRPLVEVWYGQAVLLGTEDNPNGFATFFVAGAPIAAFLSRTATSRVVKVIYGMIGFLFLLLVALTFSRSGVAGAVVGSALAIFYGNSRHSKGKRSFRTGMIVTIILIPVLAMSLFVFAQLSNQGVGTSGTSIYSNKELSQGYHLLIAEQYLPIIAQHPLVGIGYGNSKFVMEQRTGLYNNSHNILFGVAIEFGLIAGGLFVALIWLSVRSVLKGLTVAQTLIDRTTGGCILAVLIGLVIHGMFHEILVNLLLWLFLGIGGVYWSLIRNARKMRRDVP